MHELEIQINKMLLEVKKCYIERDKKNIDSLSNLLFHDEYPPIIIGTSNNEWCFGIEESKNIFLSDWEGWGNVTIDLESIMCGQSDSLGWFTVKAGVEYTFKDSDEKYASYMNLVTSIAKSDKAPIAKMSEINWFLSHLLHTRKNGERRYIWDLTISGIVQCIENIYKIRIMQFSIPVKALFPDERLDNDYVKKQEFKQELLKIAQYNGAKIQNENIPIKQAVLSLLSNQSNVKLDSSGDSQFIGTDGIKRDAIEFKQYLKPFSENGAKVDIDTQGIIIKQQETSFYFCGIGVYTRNINIDSELSRVLDNIDSYCSAKNKKEALFKLRRDLALALKESSVSDKHNAPIRFEGVGKLYDNEDILFQYVQLSYPFNWILEQKTDESVEL
ncbi:hypothetical protein [Lutispora sp.]|uniref:hypothetical protein n=1 Tax=Lutispora sp. TaxID=2828727 RepID=UPI002B1EECF3|nr:hypothetical protein [Lutispora sp.]MEA4960399.1 hypothetical protein [Lutispora sp.]